MKNTLLIIDCQYDFIEGSLACAGSNEAIDKIVDFINSNAENYEVFYSLDWHSNTNKSFKRLGGIWPDHCIQNTKGAELSPKFMNIKNSKFQPNKNNMFYKGVNDEVEEYSAFNAKNQNNEFLRDKIVGDIIVCGIASEFCVRETVLEFHKAGFNVSVLKDALGYVDYNNHIKNLDELKQMDIKLL